ncbi:MAG: SpoIIE family protein phosphatase [Bacteroidales bacterium]|nr:SpoIIE family protein phosphatase [Bacteroidales bacterium]MBN2757630.1 SpoIIE family protein phosphatase [Bacteroidales bacterium]
MKHFYIVLIIILLLPISAFNQVKNKGIPYIINYSREEYNAAAQNWSITQDKRGVMYFANALGVLEFDGQKWQLIPVNDTRVFSLAINTKGRIFVGSNDEFGYLAPDSIGRLSYVSLVQKIEKQEDKSFDVIGKILISKDKTYFVARGAIYEYFNNKIKTIKYENLKQVFDVNDRIFIRIKGKGLSEYKDGKIIKLNGGEKFSNSIISAILPYGKELLIVSYNYSDGLFLFNDKQIYSIDTQKYEYLEQQKVTSAIKLNDDNYALGLFSAGLIVIDKTGKVIQHYNTNTGLQNDKVLKVFQDKRSNIWLTLANGISTVFTSLPISLFDNKYNLNNTTYSSILFEDRLYIGNSAGIFYKEWSDFENHLNNIETFNQIGEPLEIWDLDTMNGCLLCATKGINVIKDGKIDRIKLEDNANTFWQFLKISNQQNYILAGTSTGLVLLEYKYNNKKSNKNKKNVNVGKWIFKHNIKGFSEKCRHIQIDAKNNIWFSDEKKGICKLILNEKLDSVSVEWYGTEKGISDIENNNIFKVDGQILIGSNTGIYKYDNENDKFILEKKLNEILGKDVRITLLIEDKTGNLWFKQERKVDNTNTLVFELGQLIKQKNGSFYLNKTPFYKFRNKIYSILPLNNNEILIGTEKGFIHYDSKVSKDYYKPYNALIKKVEFITNDSLIFDGSYIDSIGYVSLTQPAIQELKIPYNFNDIRFTFSSPYFDEPKNIKFKFFLEGNDDDWTDWKSKNFKEYSNLAEGDYVFHVIAKNIYEVESIEATYSFTIKPPWYRTIWAIILYFIALVLLIFGIVRLSVRRLRKQKEYLEQLVKERTKKIQMQNAELNQQKEEIEAQRDLLFEINEQIKAKNKSITASINYAKRIQEAMLPLKEKISQALTDNFILLKPRDIVSGDFYWYAEKNGKIIITAVDCTGHGVPGAFMSMIGSEILTTIVNQGVVKPSEILELKNKYIQNALKQDQTDNQDGMDMALCTIDKINKTVEYSGAKNPLIYIQNNELFLIKADSQSIGGRKTDNDKPFTNHVISYAEHVTYFYIFSDGYQDQFGGPSNRKYMIKRMKEIIFENYQKTLKEQEKVLNYSIENWMKDVEQTDDILVIGFRLEP